MRDFHLGPAFIVAAAVALSGNTASPNGAHMTIGDTQADLLTREYDEQLKYTLEAMIASAEIGPDGKVFFNRALGDRRFLEPNSGYYWQIRAEGQEDFRSRSLGDRRLKVRAETRDGPTHYDSNQFPDEPLRIAERTVRLPGSDLEWQFAAARAR